MKAGASAPEACPSAEVLAAYVDGLAPNGTRSSAMPPIATCAAHLALLSSLDEPASPSALTPQPPGGAAGPGWSLSPPASSLRQCGRRCREQQPRQRPIASRRGNVRFQNRSDPPRCRQTPRRRRHPTPSTRRRPHHSRPAEWRRSCASSTFHLPQLPLPPFRLLRTERRDQPPPPAMQTPAAPADSSAALSPNPPTSRTALPKSSGNEPKRRPPRLPKA